MEGRLTEEESLGLVGVTSPSGWTMFSVQGAKTFSRTVPTPLNGAIQPVTTERMWEWSVKVRSQKAYRVGRVGPACTKGL